MLAGRPVEGEGLVDTGLDPGAPFPVLVLPAGEPLTESATGFLGGGPVVEPAQLGEAVVGLLAREVPRRRRRSTAEQMSFPPQPPR